MATHTITLEVDSGKLFDMIAELQRESPTACGTDALGVRLAEVLLCPKHVGVFNHVGLALYGITIKDVQ